MDIQGTNLYTIDFNGRRAEMVLANDITKRKQAEEELKLKALLLDRATDSIFVHDFSCYGWEGCSKISISGQIHRMKKRSFTWTKQNGSAHQKSSIANGSKTCRFEIQVK